MLSFFDALARIYVCVWRGRRSFVMDPIRLESKTILDLFDNKNINFITQVVSTRLITVLNYTCNIIMVVLYWPRHYEIFIGTNPTGRSALCSYTLVEVVSHIVIKGVYGDVAVKYYFMVLSISLVENKQEINWSIHRSCLHVSLYHMLYNQVLVCGCACSLCSDFGFNSYRQIADVVSFSISFCLLFRWFGTVDSSRFSREGVW